MVVCDPGAGIRALGWVTMAESLRAKMVRVCQTNEVAKF